MTTDGVVPSLPQVLAEIRAGLGLPLTRLAARRGKHPATIFRWTKDGVRVGDHKVRLEAVRVGSRWETSEPAFDRFVAATNPPTPPAHPAPSLDPPTPAGRRRRAADAARELEAGGW